MNKQKQREEGFTIIEVMIVLVIAAVIILIVFLAVPALQRNSRNNQRKNDAVRVAALVGEHKINNSNRLPDLVACSEPAASGRLNLVNENLSQYDCSQVSVSTGAVTHNTSLLHVRVGYKCERVSDSRSWWVQWEPGSGNQFIVVHHAETGNGTTPICIEG